MKTSQKSSKSGLLKEIKNSFESLGDDFLGGTKQSVKDSFSDFNSQLFGNDSIQSADKTKNFDQFFGGEQFGGLGREKKEPKRIRKSEVVFNYLEKMEQSRLNHEIKQLTEAVKKEIELLKVQDQGLISDISKLTMNELPKTPGVYHLRFLEFIVKLLQTIRKKISEGRLWLQTTSGKKNQRKYRQLAKSKGTQFSMSKELTQANLPG